MSRSESVTEFYRVVWPYRADVLRFAWFLCRDASVADDLAQDTLLKAFKALGRSAEPNDVRPWLLTILRNVWNDRVRARSREDGRTERLDEADFIAAPPVVAENYAFNDPQSLMESFSDRAVIDALQSLPEEIRWTLLLVDVEGVNMSEAAEVLRVPIGTVKSRAHRGRAMLRQALLPVAQERRVVVQEVGKSDDVGLRAEVK